MGHEIEKQVPGPKAVVRMRKAESGRGLGAEASIETLLGGVEVRVALSASRAPESHSTNKIRRRTTKQHPFLFVSGPSW